MGDSSSRRRCSRCASERTKSWLRRSALRGSRCCSSEEQRRQRQTHGGHCPRSHPRHLDQPFPRERTSSRAASLGALPESAFPFDPTLVAAAPSVVDVVAVMLCADCFAVLSPIGDAEVDKPPRKSLPQPSPPREGVDIHVSPIPPQRNGTPPRACVTHRQPKEGARTCPRRWACNERRVGVRRRAVGVQVPCGTLTVGESPCPDDCSLNRLCWL
jgi:hypothetical protein